MIAEQEAAEVELLRNELQAALKGTLKSASGSDKHIMIEFLKSELGSKS